MQTQNVSSRYTEDIPDELWNDWQWQLGNRLSSVEQLRQLIRLTPEEEEGLSAEGKFHVDITPYFASLIDPDAPRCQIRRPRQTCCLFANSFSSVLITRLPHPLT